MNNQDPTTLALRLPVKDLKWLEEFAAVHCNTRLGIVRLAIRQFRNAYEAEANKQEPQPEPAAA